MGVRTGVLIAVLMGLWGGNAPASESAAGLYNRANAHYQNGEFEKAIALYELVLKQGLQNGYVYYNLGNAYYKNQQLGHAILAYERALRLIPGDEDVLANLRFVNALRVDREMAAAENVVTRFLRAIYHFFKVDTVSVLCSLCLFGIAGVAVCWMFFSLKKMLWLGLLTVLVVAGGFSGGLLAFKVHDLGVQEAVILDQEAVGRSGPGTDFLQVFTLHEGAKVTLERMEGNWWLVRLSNGIGGWLPANAMAGI